MCPYQTYIENYSVRKNHIQGRTPKIFPDTSPESFFSKLPKVIWKDHEKYINLYQKAWEISFGHIKHPTPQNGFVSSYMDTAFNDCTFMWDSAFIVQFAKYAKNAFDFMGTIDNFYSKQHKDGFICREIGTLEGEDRFEKHDPASTGPNIFAYCEWEYFQHFGDKTRLASVFPVLVGYYRWFRLYRSWQDGSYWNSGWGCGLDNSPRFEKEDLLKGFDSSMGFDFFHGYHTWLDACIHQALSGKILTEMSNILNCSKEIEDITRETQFLKQYINTKMWDDATGFYYDRDRYGKLTLTKTIIAYWSLLADIPSSERAERLIAYLNDEQTFKSKHRIPSLSMDNKYFSSDPVYWQGGTWAPTNYMVLQGLYHTNHMELAREIACNTLEQVEKVYQDTGTIWEYYCPTETKKGVVARRDFVGWSGLIPIAILIEYVFGIHVDAQTKTVHWYLGLAEEHGVEGLPVFDNGTVTLVSRGIDLETNMPIVEACADIPLTLVVHYKGMENRYAL